MRHDVVVKGEALYGIDGIYAQFESRLAAQPRISETERRHVLIGEVGEFAALEAFRREGYTVEHLSRKEFSAGEDESSIDIIATKDGKKISIQVKSSENGNRCIKNSLLCKYERDEVDLIVFVAVRQLPDFMGFESNFFCSITSTISPRDVRSSPAWEYSHGRWLHIRNSKSIRQWEKKTKEMWDIALSGCTKLSAAQLT